MLEILSILATWRITSILHREDGPFLVVDNMRNKLRGHELGHMLNCFLCTSIWVALPFSFIFNYWFIHWLAFSTGAIFIDSLKERWEL